MVNKAKAHGRHLTTSRVNRLLVLSPPGVPPAQHEEEFQVEGLVGPAAREPVYPDQEYVFGDFSERLWAYLTIQQLLAARSDQPPDRLAQPHLTR